MSVDFFYTDIHLLAALVVRLLGFWGTIVSVLI